MLTLWQDNRSDEEMDEIEQRFPRRTHLKNSLKGPSYVEIDDIDNTAFSSTIFKGLKNQNEWKQEYMPSLRNFNRRDPQRDRSWKRKRKNQYSSEG